MGMNYLNEQFLLEDLKKGSLDAYKYIYREYKYWMFIQAYSELDDELAAQDLVQEMMVDFWQFQLYENVKTTLKGYLISIIRNRAYNYLRAAHRKQKRMQEMPIQEYLLPDVDLDRNQLSEKLQRALNKLPPKTLQVFTLFYEEGLSYKQIAEITHNSRFTINSHINKARKILKKELKNSGYQ